MSKRFTKEYIEYLAYQFKKGLLTPEEYTDFEDWYNMQSEKELDLSGTGIENEEQISTKLYQNILLKLELDSARDSQRVYRLWPRIAVAAAAVLVILTTTLWYYVNHADPEQKIVGVGDIKPGVNGGTLTLADGQKIRLTDNMNGKIASQAGVEISKFNSGEVIYRGSGNQSGAVEFNTLQTARGEQAKLRLPDGSMVYLNAASSLKFPASFMNMSRRVVELSGEGYFEIAKDKSHPFIVKTNIQQVEVLGTHFNINSYQDESDLKTTLLEGSIRLTTNKASKILHPGDQAILHDGSLEIKKTDTDQIIAWKNNEFIFRGDDFRSNMRKIARWYNIEVIYETNAPDNFMLGGFLSRSRNLSEVLKLLENTDKVHFRREGRKVYVSK